VAYFLVIWYIDSTCAVKNGEEFLWPYQVGGYNLSAQAPPQKDFRVRSKVILANSRLIESNESSTQGTGFCGALAMIQAKHMDEMVEREIGIFTGAPRGCRKLDLAIRIV
jgi:hypothetical protein